MTMENTPTSALELYKASGLTDTEAGLVKEWVDKGRPGISNVKADQLLSIFLLGYSCQDIHKEFPEYPLASILWCRAKFHWDQRRDEYRIAMQDAVAKHVATVRADAVRFMGELISATHLKWRKEILKYMAAPDREKPPACIPNNLSEYGKLVSLLDEIMNPAGKIRNLPGGEDGNPLVSVTVNNGSQPEPAITVNQIDVKNALISDNKNNKK